MTATKSGLRAFFAVCAFSLVVAAEAAPAAAQAPFGCACLHNNTKGIVSFRYKWGDAQWKNDTLRAGYQETLCWRYADRATSPNLTFQIDVDLTKGAAWTTFNLPRVQAQSTKCESVAKQYHYDISYRPNTNGQFLQMTHRQ